MRWIQGSSGNLQIVLNTRIEELAMVNGDFGNEDFSMTDQVDFIYHCQVPVTYVHSYKS